MRYELGDRRWVYYQVDASNEPRGVPRVDASACFTASLGSCGLAHLGVICHGALALTQPVSIVSLADGGRASRIVSDGIYGFALAKTIGPHVPRAIPRSGETI